MVRHILDSSHCICVHSLFIRWKIWPRYSRVCSASGNQWRCLSSSEAICCEWGEAPEPVHSVCILGELPQALALPLLPWQTAPKKEKVWGKESSKVCLSCAFWSLCVWLPHRPLLHCFRGEPGGVGVVMSLEAWCKEKQKSGFEDGSKS